MYTSGEISRLREYNGEVERGESLLIYSRKSH